MAHQPPIRNTQMIVARQPSAGRLLGVPDAARAKGIRIQAGSGSGKTELASMIAHQDWQRGKPQVLFDPYGGLIKAFLWRVMQTGATDNRPGQADRFDRILYVDMSGELTGHVAPFPLFHRRGQEPFYNIGQRIYEAIIRLDPELKSASVQGANAIQRTLVPMATVLAALGPEYQVGALIDLINYPSSGRWAQRLDEVASKRPEMQAAVDFIRKEYLRWDRATKLRNLSSLEVKLDPFRYSPALTAIYGSIRPGLDYESIIARGQTVCLDFGRVVTQEQRRFGLVWTLFYSLLPFIRYRGVGYQHRPLGIVVDELSALQADTPLGRDLLAQDLNELINILRRQYRLWLTLVHQEAYQLDEKVAKNLMSLGTQILGVSDDFESSMATAKQFFSFEAKVKRWEPVYFSTPEGPEVIDLRPVEYSLNELQHMGAQVFRRLKQFRFVCRIPQGEGGAAGGLHTLNIRPLLGPFIDEAAVLEVQKELSVRDGFPIEQMLAEIAESRLLREPEPSAMMAGNDDDPVGLPDRTVGGVDEDDLHS